MYVLPPAANPLVPATDSDWLLPIRFGIKPYLELCHSFDRRLRTSRPAILPIGPC